MVSGEALHPYMRRAMEEAFGGVAIDNYGSSEAPGLAFECGHGVFQCQMAQVSPYRIDVKVKVLEGRDEGEVKNGVRRNLERFLGSLGLTNVNVGISPELPRANPKSGKFKAVARLVEKN